MWLIVQVRLIMKSRLNNDMTDGKVVVYDEIIIEMS